MVDPQGYLTSLSGSRSLPRLRFSDVKKARRLLLKSVIGTNPKHAPGWIAAARLEELAGKLQAARSFIQRGCDACPQSQDVWIEAAPTQQPRDGAAAILARGVVSALPRSTEIWIAAAKLEETDERKRRVLQSLENIPNSVRLWKAVVDLSSEEDARVLLSRAVECCPQHADLWLALARLETRDKARVVLNKARETLPTEPGIWIAAAKLEEANDNAAIVGRILERAVKSLAAHGVAIDREFWLKEAETAERRGSLARDVSRDGPSDHQRRRGGTGPENVQGGRGGVRASRVAAHRARDIRGGASRFRGRNRCGWARQSGETRQGPRGDGRGASSRA